MESKIFRPGEPVPPAHPRRPNVVLALIRFSFLGSDNIGYRRTRRASFQERQDLLFAESRMGRRFAVFERVCLPSLAAQPADAFSAIVLASESMPDRYKERLENSLAGYPNLKVGFEPPEPFPYTAAFLKHVRGMDRLGDVILTCRVDDDDALAAGYAEQALQFIEARHLGYVLSFPRGLHVAGLDGEPRFWETYYPLIGAGLGLIQRPDTAETVYSCGHHQQLWQRFPVIVDGRKPQYMVTLHGENDSTPRRSWKDRLLRRAWHPNPHRNPPKGTLSLSEARKEYSESFPALQSDWDRFEERLV